MGLGSGASESYHPGIRRSPLEPDNRLLLFDDLMDDSEDQAIAIAAESADRVPSEAPLIKRPFDCGAVITYPFVNFNGQRTRFSDGLCYGGWYGSLGRRCRGINADILVSGVLSGARDLCYLTYRIDPTRDLVRVERTPRRKWLVIRPGGLR